MVIFLKLQIVCFKYLQISQNIVLKILWKQYFTTLRKCFVFFSPEELNNFLSKLQQLKKTTHFFL